MLPLQPDSPIALHHQLERRLRDEIASGRWRPGEAIASERELMQLAGVSRATVRQALASLMQGGLLERQHGRGTFVAQPKIEQDLHAVYSFWEQMAALGRTMRDQVLRRQIIPAPPPIAALLSVEPGERLIQIQRLRFVDDVPLTLDSSFIPHAICPELLHDDLSGSLYRLLSERYALPPLRATDTLEATTADRASAFHLGVAPGAPLLYVERVAYSHNDLPLQVGRNHVRGDRVRFRINLWSGIEFKL
ncbi:MAG: GntR family transcriptional regulator [Chloroflexales bacterium]|nr:GntR family transcriptional regulator [Chloroflexales bacterium]